MAFCDLKGNMDHGEELMKHLTRHAMEYCGEDLSLFTRFVDKGLQQMLDILVHEPYERISYADARIHFIKIRQAI